MSTLTTIAATDIISASRSVINANFATLNSEKVDIAGTYADPLWLTSISGAKVTGGISGNAATATRLATARTIAGVAFDGTANIAIASTGLSDSADIVRGGAALTTVGSVPFVTSSGVLGQSGNLFWDNANARLGVGTNAPAVSIDTTGVVSSAGGAVQLGLVSSTFKSGVIDAGRIKFANLTITDSGGSATLENSGGGAFRVSQSGAGGIIRFDLQGTERARFTSTGNLLLGTTTDDGTNRLQVAGSVNVTSGLGLGANNATSQSIALSIRPGNDGVTSSGAAVTYSLGGNIYSQMQLFGTTASSQFLHDLPSGGITWRSYSGFNSLMALTTAGALTLFNQTPTIGSTSLVVRAGAGQGSNNLQTWQNSSGTAQSRVIGGAFETAVYYGVASSTSFSGYRAVLGPTQLELQSGALVSYSATAEATATKDLSLSRASANTLQVGDGGANALGTVRAASFTDGTNTAVLGGNNLSTVGSVPFVTSSGVLGQDAGLAWDATNKQLSLFRNSADASRIRISNTNGAAQILVTATGATQIRNEASGQPIIFEQSTERARFAATSGNLLLGTTTDDGVNRLQVAGSARITGTGVGLLKIIDTSATGYSGVNFATSTGSRNYTAGVGGASEAAFGVADKWFVYDGISGAMRLSIATTGNVGIGSTTDNGFRLDVAASGSSGTTRIYDQTPTTGSTSLVVRAGAGQSGNLQTWQSAAGSTLTSISSAGRLETSAGVLFTNSFGGVLGPLPSNMGGGKGIAIGFNNEGDGAVFARQYLLQGATATTTDLSLSRASAGVLQVGDGGANANGAVNARSIALATSAAFGTHITFDTNTGADGIITSSSAGSLQFGTTNVGPLVLIHNNVELLQLSSNTVTITNPTPTTGSTSLVVRAGAGQGSNLLQQWQNSSGSSRLQVTSSLGMQALGTFFAVQDSGGTISRAILQSTLDFNDSGSVRWSSTGDAGGTIDLAARRRAAGLFSLDSGTAIGTTPGNARDIMARGFYAAETTTDPSAADLSIAGSNAQDTFRLYMKNDKLVIAYQRSGTVNYLTIPLDGATTTFTQSTTAP